MNPLLATAVGILVLLGQCGLGFEQQFACSAIKGVRYPQDHCERWHVLATFDFPHVGSLDASLMGQSFLSNAIRCSESSNYRAERKGWLGLKCRCP
jgi:hypothetical protein